MNNQGNMNSQEGTRIILCGAGTLGGNLAEQLARTGVRRFSVIDADLVEERNLANQPYAIHDVGQPKVKALAAFLLRAVGAEVAGARARLRPENAARLLTGVGLVVDAFDNAPSRRAVKDACEALAIPCLHIGLSPDSYGEVIWNGRYRVPPDENGAPCRDPLSRTLAILVVAVTAEAIRAYLETGAMDSYTITLADLAVRPL